ncbi:DsbA family protein [Halomonas salifodinae]|uniref:DsbA family protein n=1 Tax=Halomonas salifodinae TaxID=438745 RepID=UPI0033A77674
MHEIIHDLPTTETQVLYVADAYCGWCWGFTPHLAELEAARRHVLPFRVISGGLFVGERSAPLGAYPYIPEANERITQVTGARFGEAYHARLAEGTLRMDSADAARGLAGLRAQAPERGLHLLHRMQEAFYRDGRSLSDPDTYRAIARDEGLDGERAADYLTNDEGRQAAEADFRLARRLGVHQFPTLLLLKDGEAHPLPAIGASLAAMIESLEARLCPPS